MIIDRGTVRENVHADITNTNSQHLDESIVSAVRGSLAAGNGHTFINSSKSLRGPVPHTTTVGEYDTGEICPAVRVVPRRLARWHTSATKFKARCEMVNVAERPNTIDDMIQEINHALYLNMYTSVVILLVMSVSTASPVPR